MQFSGVTRRAIPAPDGESSSPDDPTGAGGTKSIGPGWSKTTITADFQVVKAIYINLFYIHEVAP